MEIPLELLAWIIVFACPFSLMRIPTWFTSPPFEKNTMSPIWASSSLNLTLASNWSAALLGMFSPYCCNTKLVNPLQSNPLGSIPADTYGTPNCFLAMSISSFRSFKDGLCWTTTSWNTWWKILSEGWQTRRLCSWKKNLWPCIPRSIHSAMPALNCLGFTGALSFVSLLQWQSRFQICRKKVIIWLKVSCNLFCREQWVRLGMFLLLYPNFAEPLYWSSTVRSHLLNLAKIRNWGIWSLKISRITTILMFDDPQ